MATAPTAPTPATTLEVEAPANQSPIALIVRPENQTPKRNGPIRLPVMVTAKGRANGKTATEAMVSGEFLTPGTQFVAPEVFAQMQQHPFWPALVKANVIEVVGAGDAGGESQTPGLTCTYSSETDAFRLISNTLDMEWLESSKHREERKSVNSAIRDRITELNDQMTQKQEGER
jgi:hypothetical protein